MYRVYYYKEFGQNWFEWKFMENEDMIISEQSVIIKK